MTIEEKAKAYDEALERARKLKENPQMVFYEYTPKEGDTICDYIFPELRESDDEEIRNFLIDYINHIDWGDWDFSRKQCIDWLEKQKEQSVISHKFNAGDWIVSKWGGIYQIKEVMSGSYNLLCTNNTEEINSITQVDNNSRLLCMSDIKKLEKQGEQKPYGQRAECFDCQDNYAGECKGFCELKRDEQKPAWSEEDEENMEKILDAIGSYYYLTTDDDILCDWLKSLKYRTQPKQEWSKEDDGVLLESISILQNSSHWILADKLKSLMYKNHWKPSEEQMEVLLSEVNAWTKGCPKQKVLESLYNDLKKIL